MATDRVDPVNDFLQCSPQALEKCQLAAAIRCLPMLLDSSGTFDSFIHYKQDNFSMKFQ